MSRKKQPKRKVQLSLKYRPNRLSLVLGQDSAVADIRGMIKSGRIHRTILLAGPHSAGKTTLARLLALYLNCDDLTSDFEPCGKCPSCRAMVGVIAGNGSHPAVTEIDAATKRGIDDIRSLQQLAELAPVTNYRIFILDECQQMTKDAWSASLKTFERPPARTIFILCTTDPEVLPKTILSRAHRIALKAIPIKTTSLLLKKVATKEGYEVSKKIRQQIASLTEGHPREALNILESVFNHLDAADGKVDLEDAFPKILNQSNVYKAYIAAQDFMNGVIAGKFGAALKAIKGADNLVFFTTQIVTISRIIVELIIDRSLMDRQNYWTVSKVAKVDQNFGREHIAEFNQILKIFLDAQAKIKTFLQDPTAVLEAAAIDAILIVHQMERARKRKGARS